MAEPSAVLLVRLRPGFVGLTRRVVHIVPVPRDDSMPKRLTTFCGQLIEPGQADLLDGPTGTPCTTCLLKAP